jgi:3-methylcrotonyl-CoA carboxylase alpha subunit
MSQGQLRQEFPASGPAFSYEVTGTEDSVRVTLGEETLELNVTTLESGSGEGWCRTADGRSHPFMYVWVGSQLQLWLEGYLFAFERVESRRRGSGAAANRGREVLAPMPGTVLQVMVQAGDRVERDQPVLVLESMKMELIISAPREGIVKDLPVAEGSRVEKGMRLLELEEEDSENSTQPSLEPDDP